MRIARVSAQFKKDFKRIVARGYDTDKLDCVVDLLLENSPLPMKYRDHQLSNNWKDFRELHISPDWLLVYSIEDDDVVMFARTGTHSDIFGK